MIKIEHTEVVGWEHAIRGMRNPMNSWEKSDSVFHMVGYEQPRGYDILGNLTYPDEWINLEEHEDYIIGPNDHKLMMQLAKAGTTHSKYRRMITVYCDITAPLYWWKEFDTYKVGTAANSCSTMHKIQARALTLEDFSCEHLYTDELECLKDVIGAINGARALYLCAPNKKCDWWQMIQLLPSSYNQKRTVMMNYEVLAGIYPNRKDHKLDEWHDFCDWIKTLPYSELITLENPEQGRVLDENCGWD